MKLRKSYISAIIFTSIAAFPASSAIACGLNNGANNFLANGDFAQGTNNWNLPNNGVYIAQLDICGTYAMSAQQRQKADASPLQTFSQMPPAGVPLVTRFRIQLPVHATVRAFLRQQNGVQVQKFLLAEKTVLTTNQFVAIEGISTPSLNTALGKPTFYLEVQQGIEKIYPDYVLDDVYISQDSDKDGLSDSEELALGTNPNHPDTDLDGMPDGWEMNYRTTGGLNSKATNVTKVPDPLIDDAKDDIDGDGFSNLEEYWAATDPLYQPSYPGAPANPAMNATARSILTKLALLPSQTGKRVIAGQHVFDSLANDIQGYDHSIYELEQATGKSIGLVELQYDGIDNQSQYQIADTNLRAIEAWSKGGLVAIKWNPWIPWNGMDFNHKPSFSLVDIKGMLAKNSPANAAAMQTFDIYLDTVAAGLQELQDKDIVVLWRLMSEMNGGWFWWGARTRDEYVELWRYIHYYLTVKKQLNNLIWVYEGDSKVHAGSPVDYYYPGDDLVDVAGHNVYNDTWQLPYDFNALYRHYGKVYAIPQAGSANGSIVRQVKYGWDNMVIVNGIKASFPRVSYFSVWNSFPGGGPNQNQYVAIVDQLNAVGLFNDPWIASLSDIPWH